MEPSTILRDESLYVAEVHIPTNTVSSSDTRIPLGDSKTLGIVRGYCRLKETDTAGRDTPLLANIAMMLEFLSPSLKKAENHAIKIGQDMSSAVASSWNTPFQEPRLFRIAHEDVTNKIISQHHYTYLPEPAVIDFGGTNLLNVLPAAIHILESLDTQTSERVIAAQRWYGMALAADDHSISYLAAWMGLEYIGMLLNQLWHKNGVKVTCKVCQNSPNNNTDRKMAGIEHGFGLLASGQLIDLNAMAQSAQLQLRRDIKTGFTFEQAKAIRNDLVHGLEQHPEARVQASEFRRHVTHVLYGCIRHLVRVTARAVLPAEHRVGPDLRYSIKFRTPQDADPYLDKWPTVVELKIAADSNYSKSGFTRTIEAQIDEASQVKIGFECSEPFSRGIGAFDLTNEESEPVPMSGLVAWEDRPDEPDWETYTPKFPDTPAPAP